ncbi:procathepsin L-like [Engraulis encrasicolus]|uniref:procathepsin L-like n=1 Tax=Engraulis encrasicolus TaxID=184585 RepID=UPI002FCF448F
MKWLIVAAACLAVVSCASLSLDQEFNEWKVKFGKSYPSLEEEAHRKGLWLSNRQEIQDHNQLADQGVHSFRMGMNQFSDLDHEEFRQTVLIKMDLPEDTAHGASEPFRAPDNVGLAASMDWRTSGCVSPVKNQAHCGSCWSFSATGALESQTCLRHGNLPSLSEQQLVDCSSAYGNHGCHGGTPDRAFKYIQANGGIDSESYYPYQARVGTCHYNSAYSAATCTGYHDVTPRGSEAALQYQVANVGPLSIAIDASGFQHYHSGVFNYPSCSLRPNHAVLLVGYGTYNGQDYWLVKNSWGSRWGEQGYIMMARNANNQCAIASHASYPTV